MRTLPLSFSCFLFFSILLLYYFFCVSCFLFLILLHTCYIEFPVFIRMGIFSNYEKIFYYFVDNLVDIFNMPINLSFLWSWKMAWNILSPTLVKFSVSFTYAFAPDRIRQSEGMAALLARVRVCHQNMYTTFSNSTPLRNFPFPIPNCRRRVLWKMLW